MATNGRKTAINGEKGKTRLLHIRTRVTSTKESIAQQNPTNGGADARIVPCCDCQGLFYYFAEKSDEWLFCRIASYKMIESDDWQAFR